MRSYYEIKATELSKYVKEQLNASGRGPIRWGVPNPKPADRRPDRRTEDGEDTLGRS